MTVHQLTLGDYRVNCYLIHAQNSDRCAIIDPGYDAPAILQKLQELGLKPDAILLTHGHFDHVGAVTDLLKAAHCELWLSRADCTFPPSPMTNFLYPLIADLPEIRICRDGDTLSVGGLTVSVLATPGHTPGSVCYLCEDAIFSGDTLFAGSVGRTDLLGGSWDTLAESLAKLRALETDYTLYPGHGELTTVFREKMYNPYLR